MKKAVITITLIIASILAIGYVDTHYTRKDCTVVSICGDSIEARDASGNCWEFTGKGLHIGDKIDLKMHNSNTDSIYDDRVVGFRR